MPTKTTLITLTFKAGRLLDAQSALGDQKLLRCLQHQGLINDSQIRRIQQIQRETGLSVREILAKLAYLPLVEIKAHITMSIFEVLRQLFLLDRGDFNFTETPVEDDGAGIQMDISHAALTVLPQADEYRDFIKTIQTAERRVRVNDSLTAPQNTSSSARMIFKFARQQPTVHELISKTPLPSHEVLQHIQQFLVQEVITLLAPNPQNLAPAARRPPWTHCFLPTNRRSKRSSAITKYCPDWAR